MTEDAADVATEEEPSIEEILDSIRQIISDDEDDGGEEGSADTGAEDPAPEPEAQPEPEPEPPADEPTDESEEEPIELTEVVSDSAGEDEAAPEPEMEIDMVGPEDETPEPADDPEDEAEAPAPEEAVEPEPEPESETAIEDDISFTEDETAQAGEDSILTDKAEGAALDGFTHLVKKTAVEHGGITLEDIVRSELNPLLREWLDKNLPSIIERLVQDELEKIAKRALEE